jgi:hypothetical protein
VYPHPATIKKVYIKAETQPETVYWIWNFLTMSTWYKKWNTMVKEILKNFSL